MIDIHTHILPYMDDGAKDVEIAAAMLKEELAQGVHTVLLTSHYYGKKHSPAHYLAKREESLNRLKPYIPEGINLRLGAEVYFTGMNTASFELLCPLAIEGTKYILLELPLRREWSPILLERVEDFIDQTGYTPIIAHVERYKEVWAKPIIVTKLVQLGCLIQINAESLCEKRTRRLMCKFLKKGLVHCVGTDAHNLEERAPVMQKAKEAMVKTGCLKEWETMQENMQKILGGGACMR